MGEVVRNTWELSMIGYKETMQSCRLALDVPEDLAHLKTVRHAVREMLASVDVTQQDRDDVELLVGELAANAVRHANSGLAYHVEVEVEDDIVIVTVTDQGKGFAREKVALPGTARADRRADGIVERLGGWGLPMVEILADRVDFLRHEPHGTKVRAEKQLQFRN